MPHARGRAWLQGGDCLRPRRGDPASRPAPASRTIRLSLLADEPLQAALLAGVADAVLAESGVELLTGERDVFEEAKASTRQALGDEAFAAAHAEGLATAVPQALDDAGFIAN